MDRDAGFSDSVSPLPRINSLPLWIVAALSVLLALPCFPQALLLTVPLGLIAGSVIYAILRSRANWRALIRGHRQLGDRVEDLERALAALRHDVHAVAGNAPADAPAVQPVAVAAPVSLEPPPVLDFESRETPVPSPMAAGAPVAEPTTTSQSVPADDFADAAAAVAQGTSRTTTAAAPSLFDTAVVAAREWLLGGNTVARVGLLVLFVGVAFLLRYVAERTSVPIEVRLIGVALGALVFLGLGWRMRARRPGFAVTLQGGAIGILYLTAFAALRLYEVLPPLPAFAFMAALATLSGALAVLQDARALAAMGAAGGFLAPILVSTGEGRFALLATYYLILNLGVLGIALFRAWRELNWIAFAFAFGVSGLWAVRRYTPEDFVVGQGFLAAFWLLFLVVSLLYALRQQGARRGIFDTSLVFALPLAAFGIQTRFTEGFDLAVASTVAAAVYLAVSAWLLRRRDATLQLLTEASFALGVGFLTLAIPLAASAQWTAAAWALEGVALLWVGLRQQRLLPTVAGLVLHAAGALALLAAIDRGQVSLAPVLSGATVNLAVFALTAFFSAWLLARATAWHSALGVVIGDGPWVARLIGWAWVIALLWQPLAFPWYVGAWCALALALVAFARSDGARLAPEWVAGVALVVLAAIAAEARLPADSAETMKLLLRLAVAATAVATALLSLRAGSTSQRTAAAALLTLGVLVWLLALLAETMARIDAQLAVAQVALVLIGVTALALVALGRGIGWIWPLQLAWAYFVAHIVLAAYVVAIAVFGAMRPSLHFGWAAWPAAWALLYLLLAQDERSAVKLPLPGAIHVAALWLLVGMIAAEFALRVDIVAGDGWFHAIWGATIALALWLIVQQAPRWPLRAAPFAYATVGAPGLAAAAAAWLLWANLRSADPAPLPALPLLNPLDLASLLALAALTRWHLADSRPAWRARVRMALAGAAFFVVNVVALRAVHFVDGVPWTVHDLGRSLLVQSVLSLLWTLIAMALMVVAHRRVLRPVWTVGAALLAVVVAKLFFVDLSGQGTVERIVSFVGVGLLILVVGYLAPVPPAAAPRSKEVA